MERTPVTRRTVLQFGVAAATAATLAGTGRSAEKKPAENLDFVIDSRNQLMSAFDIQQRGLDAFLQPYQNSSAVVTSASSSLELLTKEVRARQAKIGTAAKWLKRLDQTVKRYHRESTYVRTVARITKQQVDEANPLCERFTNDLQKSGTRVNRLYRNILGAMNGSVHA